VLRPRAAPGIRVSHRESIGSRATDSILAGSVLLLVASAVVMPAITSGENIRFPVGAIEMNVRVAFYLLVSALTASAAAFLIFRFRPRPLWFLLLGSLIGWALFTALMGLHSPVEWMPTVARLSLYFSAASIMYLYARSLPDAARVRRFSLILPIVLLTAAVIPAVAGVAELLGGAVPILNGAPRVSGSMPGHTVAFSLVFVVAAIATIGPAFETWPSRGAWLRWLIMGALTVAVFMTFTRLSVLILAAAAVLVAALLPADRRTRWTRIGSAALLALMLVLLAQPLFSARFVYETPLSGVISRPDPAASPAPDPTAPGKESDGSANDGFDIDVDASVAFRVMLTQRGLEYVSRSPVVGHGPGSFDRLYEEESGRAGVAAHNDLMSFAVETGLPGLALYLASLAAIAWALWPRGSSGIGGADALIVSALAVLVLVNIGAVIHNPTYFVEIQLPIWILVGSGLGLREWASRRADIERPSLPKP
jgi:O-antigen ligase